MTGLYKTVMKAAVCMEILRTVIPGPQIVLNFNHFSKEREIHFVAEHEEYEKVQ